MKKKITIIILAEARERGSTSYEIKQYGDNLSAEMSGYFLEALLKKVKLNRLGEE